MQQIGTVKWFDKQSGFGFIIPDAGGEEIFVHFSNIIPSEPNGRRSLSQGQRVAYTTTIVNNEQHLVSVTPLAQ
nr:cold shock domain-containing protein [Beggiatoa alba]